MIHTCVQCNGEKVLDFYECGWSDIEGDIRECDACGGQGKLEVCQCSAYMPSECCCGAWDDVYDDGEW